MKEKLKQGYMLEITKKDGKITGSYLKKSKDGMLIEKKELTELELHQLQRYTALKENIDYQSFIAIDYSREKDYYMAMYGYQNNNERRHLLCEIDSSLARVLFEVNEKITNFKNYSTELLISSIEDKLKKGKCISISQFNAVYIERDEKEIESIEELTKDELVALGHYSSFLEDASNSYIFMGYQQVTGKYVIKQQKSIYNSNGRPCYEKGITVIDNDLVSCLYKYNESFANAKVKGKEKWKRHY